MKSTRIFLGLMLLFPVWASQEKETTPIGLGTKEKSWSVRVPINDCHDIDEEELSTLFTKKKCMVFTGPSCTGNMIQLTPGEHSSDDPVPVGSIHCMS